MLFDHDPRSKIALNAISSALIKITTDNIKSQHYDSECMRNILIVVCLLCLLGISVATEPSQDAVQKALGIGLATGKAIQYADGGSDDMPHVTRVQKANDAVEIYNAFLRSYYLGNQKMIDLLSLPEMKV